MNKSKITSVYILLVLMFYVTSKPAHAIDLESAFGTLSDSHKSSEISERSKSGLEKIDYKTSKRSKDGLERASYKIVFKLTDQMICGSTGCIAAVIGDDLTVAVSFRGTKRAGIYPATINNLTQGVSNFDGVAVNNKSNGIGFIVPYVFEDQDFIFDLNAVCGGRFISGKRRIEGTCSTEYNTRGFAVTHRGSFSGFRQ